LDQSREDIVLYDDGRFSFSHSSLPASDDAPPRRS
jgi:hypothetical protein